MTTDRVRALADVLWDYHRLVVPLAASDIILVLGCHDTRVAEHAAEVWRAGWAPLVVFTGGRGKITTSWSRSEASVFADIAERGGVPRAAMLLEETSTNTGENVTRSRALLADSGIAVGRAVLVAKPYMARRAVATAAKQWPEVDWLVSAPAQSFAAYAAGDQSTARTINLMVGDLQRVKVYAERGFQTPMPIPAHVWAAYEELVSLGYDRYVLADEPLRG